MCNCRKMGFRLILVKWFCIIDEVYIFKILKFILTQVLQQNMNILVLLFIHPFQFWFELDQHKGCWASVRDPPRKIFILLYNILTFTRVELFVWNSSNFLRYLSFAIFIFSVSLHWLCNCFTNFLFSSSKHFNLDCSATFSSD